MNIRKYFYDDIEKVMHIWNEAVDSSNCFMDEEHIGKEDLMSFLGEQTEAKVAEIDGEVVGFYSIHPNLIGRCGHISNAVYAVSSKMQGNGIGKALVEDSIKCSKENGFIAMQFNAVVSTNYSAISLYLKLGFRVIGTIPNGFMLQDETFADTMIFLKTWD